METKSNENSNYNKCQNWQKESLVRLLPGLELIPVGWSSEVNHLIFEIISRTIFFLIINAKFVIYSHIHFYLKENNNEVKYPFILLKFVLIIMFLSTNLLYVTTLFVYHVWNISCLIAGKMGHQFFVNHLSLSSNRWWRQICMAPLIITGHSDAEK